MYTVITPITQLKCIIYYVSLIFIHLVDFIHPFMDAAGKEVSSN